MSFKINYRTMNGQIASIGLVPVIKFESSQKVKPLAEALIRGGVPCLEVAFRSLSAASALHELRDFPDLLLGAGTILNVQQASQAVENGARFLVSPGLSQDVAAWAIQNHIPYYPGAVTPTEIQSVLALGLEVVKFFPAALYGGPKALEFLAPVFPQLKFFPTGGVNLDNLADYLSLPFVLACGGTTLIPARLIEEGRYQEIENLCCRAVEVIKQRKAYTGDSDSDH